MGAAMIDILLHPIFSFLVILTLIFTVIALVLLALRRQLTAGPKVILSVVIMICVVYLLLAVGLMFLFDSSPPQPPTPAPG